VVYGKGDKTLWQYGTQFEYLRDSMIPSKKLTVENDGELSQKACRGERTAIELFIAGVRGWESNLWRHCWGGKP